MWLLAASYYFYMCWSVKYASLLFLSTFVTWISGNILQSIEDREVDILKKKIKKSMCGSMFYF